MKKILLLGLSLLFIGCSKKAVFTTEVINNTDEPIEIVVGEFKGMDNCEQRFYWLEKGETIVFDSVDDVYSVLYPRKYWTFGRVKTKADENKSIEINPDGFFVENF
jgi:hypothetical protein